jgi:hypothetical protein
VSELGRGRGNIEEKMKNTNPYKAPKQIWELWETNALLDIINVNFATKINTVRLGELWSILV